MEERWIDLEGEELAEYNQKKKALEEERQRERETEVELMDYEQNIQQDLNGVEHMANDLIPANSGGGLQRLPSIPMERSNSLQSTASFQSSILEAPILKRAGVFFKDMSEKDDILTFSFIPPQETESAWDEYGAMYDATEIMGEEEAKKAGVLDQHGKRLAGSGKSNDDGLKRTPTTNSGEQKGEKEAAREDVEDMGARKKIAVSTEKVVRCDVRVIDFDGRMSVNDLFEFVDYVKPRKLVVVRSSQQDSDRFAIECQNKPACGVALALAPAPGECLDIAADSSVVRVRLADETLQYNPAPLSIGNFVVQRLRGKMALRSMAGANQTDLTQGKRRRVVTTGGELPTIVPLKEGENIAGDSADSYFVSRGQEPNWESIMDRLSKINIETKLVTVDEKLVLMCGGDDVVVWKPGDGQFIVGGPLCDAYFTVRRALYDCFALV
jgi:hypothetical protein